jgi:hypothetical protein
MITFPQPLVLQYEGIFRAISDAGYGLREAFIDGVGTWVVSGPGTKEQNEAAVQAIINGYNFVGELKKLRRIEIKKERTNRYYLQYPPELVVPDQFLEETHKDLFGNVIEVALDIWASINAGSKSAHGYWEIRLDNKLYKAHRLVWLYHYGKFPEKHLDHINRIKTDNRIENLRECNDAENGQNQNKFSNNKSGLTGVSWHAASNKWISKICLNRKQIYLGTYEDKNEAYQAYLTAKQQYHTFQPNI